jgi:hypothetical protein
MCEFYKWYDKHHESPINFHKPLNFLNYGAAQKPFRWVLWWWWWWFINSTPIWIPNLYFRILSPIYYIACMFCPHAAYFMSVTAKSPNSSLSGKLCVSWLQTDTCWILHSKYLSMLSEGTFLPVFSSCLNLHSSHTYLIFHSHLTLTTLWYFMLSQ